MVTGDSSARPSRDLEHDHECEHTKGDQEGRPRVPLTLLRLGRLLCGGDRLTSVDGCGNVGFHVSPLVERDFQVAGNHLDCGFESLNPSADGALVVQ